MWKKGKLETFQFWERVHACWLWDVADTCKNGEKPVVSKDGPQLVFSSVAQLCLTLRPHGLEHTRLPCLSPTPRVCSNSCPSSWWYLPTISSSGCPLLLRPPSKETGTSVLQPQGTESWQKTEWAWKEFFQTGVQLVTLWFRSPMSQNRDC